MTRALRRPRTMATAAVAVAMVLLVACGPSVGRPAIRQVPNAPKVFDNSDPAVLVAGGQTYLFGSSNNKKVPVRRITDFGASLQSSQDDWARNPTDAMPTRPAWVDPGEWVIWAPSVARIGSQYVMYFAAMNREATTDENNDQCIGRAFSSSPTGPYAPASAPVYCGLPAEGAIAGQPPSNRFGRGALDPEVVRSADGSLHLLVVLSRTGDNIGSVRLDADGLVIGGLNAKPSILASQGLSWHDGAESADLPITFIENPSMVYEPSTKTYLLFYSAGAWFTSSYVTGFARCTGPAGPCTLDERAPFLKQGPDRTGVGGLTAFRSASGSLKVAYASWARGHEAPSGADNPRGIYSRQTHWADLVVSSTSDPSQQSVSLR